jgi:hypothetical protein
VDVEAIDERPPLRVEVLGPLRLVVKGTPVDVRGPKRRAVLALLALAEGRAVSVDHLVDALWPSDVPESGRQALHSHVSRLRGQLGSAAARLETLDGGTGWRSTTPIWTWHGRVRCWSRGAPTPPMTRPPRPPCSGGPTRCGVDRCSPT